MTGRDGWLVYACRTDFTADVLAILERLGEPVAALVDNLPGNDAVPGAIRPADLDDDLRARPAVIPLITPGHRHVVVAEARDQGITQFPPLVDPTAIAPSSTTIGEGAVVNAGVVVGGSVTIGRFTHVNRSASIGHHSLLHDLVTLGPGCVLAGRVEVHPGAFVGAGAVIAPKVVVGANAVVGAGAVVLRDVPPGSVVVGNPSTVLRQDGTGYGGVVVPT